jgi:hypothetical protein
MSFSFFPSIIWTAFIKTIIGNFQNWGYLFIHSLLRE